MYIPGRLRTASKPSRTLMDRASYDTGWLLLCAWVARTPLWALRRSERGFVEILLSILPVDGDRSGHLRALWVAVAREQVWRLVPPRGGRPPDALGAGQP